jgi:hypothetical protein
MRRLAAITVTVFLVILAFLSERVLAGEDPTQASSVFRPSPTPAPSSEPSGSSGDGGYGDPGGAYDGDRGEDGDGPPPGSAPGQGGGVVPDQGGAVPGPNPPSTSAS